MGCSLGTVSSKVACCELKNKRFYLSSDMGKIYDEDKNELGTLESLNDDFVNNDPNSTIRLSYKREDNPTEFIVFTSRALLNYL